MASVRSQCVFIEWRSSPHASRHGKQKGPHLRQGFGLDGRGFGRRTDLDVCLVVSAYQQGAVDVGMTGASAVESRKLYEVMDHMTLSFDSAIEFVAIINNDFFNSLSPEHQQIIWKRRQKSNKSYAMPFTAKKLSLSRPCAAR